jgi:hypothetical protein
MDSDWRREAEPLLLERGAHLEVRLDRPDQAQAKVRMLAMAEGPTAAFRRVVGAFPVGVVQERTQPAEMVDVQMLLLPA